MVAASGAVGTEETDQGAAALWGLTQAELKEIRPSLAELEG